MVHDSRDQEEMVLTASACGVNTGTSTWAKSQAPAVSAVFS